MGLETPGESLRDQDSIVMAAIEGMPASINGEAGNDLKKTMLPRRQLREGQQYTVSSLAFTRSLSYGTGLCGQ